MIAELLAIGSAASIAASALFVGALKGRVGLIRLTRWQLTFAFVMTAALSAVLGGWRTLGAEQVWLLLASGLFGIVIASSTYYAAIYSIGPRLTALLFSLASPFALALGYLGLGETITPMQALGVALVVAGIGLALAVKTPGSAGEGRVSALGVTLGIVTALGQALGGLFARPAMLAGVEPATAMAVRTGLAVVILLAFALTPWSRREKDAAGLREFGIAAVAAFFGTVLGMSLLMGALTHGGVGIVTTLSSTTPILILPMVWALTGERPGLAGWAGAALAVFGTGLISLS